MAAALGIFFIEYIATTMAHDRAQEHSHSLPKSVGVASNSDDDKFGHCNELAVLSTSAQSLGIIILEAGICFHSIIIGMDLSVATGDEFTSLWIALVFHQVSVIRTRLSKINYQSTYILCQETLSNL